MKYISLVLMSLIAVMFAACGDDSSSATSSSGKGSLLTLTDSRDGWTYKTVTIGTQTWMAQNLNYETANSYCYKDSAKYCAKYGRLYTWAAAMDSAGTLSTNGKGCGDGTTCSPTYPLRGVCPSGWHLPTVDEFTTLVTTVGGMSTAGKMLKSTSGWIDGNGTDDFSFLALPAGSRLGEDDYVYEGSHTHLWCSTELNSGYACCMALFNTSDRANVHFYSKNEGYSVRCVKD